MSRIADNPITLPKGVEVTLKNNEVTVTGSKGTLSSKLHHTVSMKKNDDILTFDYDKENLEANKQAGTARANVRNMVIGVCDGFQKKLTLIGVGYRAQVQGNKLSLTLGFSHPVEYDAPEGITFETPIQTEVIVKGISKQLVGQVAANIREYRPPEPYKGKGVRYSDERVVRKEAKKK